MGAKILLTIKTNKITWHSLTRMPFRSLDLSLTNMMTSSMIKGTRCTASLLLKNKQKKINDTLADKCNERGQGVALEFGLFWPKSKADWSLGSDSCLCNQKLFNPILLKGCPLEVSKINLKGSSVCQACELSSNEWFTQITMSRCRGPGIALSMGCFGSLCVSHFIKLEWFKAFPSSWFVMKG